MAGRVYLLLAELFSLLDSPVGPSPLCFRDLWQKDAGQMSRSCIPFHKDEKQEKEAVVCAQQDVR